MCKIHNNIEFGELATKHTFSGLETENTAYYVLLENIYAKRQDFNKTTGPRLNEIIKRIHAFLVGDKSHYQSDDFRTLAKAYMKGGYVPFRKFVGKM